MGRRAGDGGEAPPARDHDGRPGRRHPGGGARLDARPRLGAGSSTPSRTTATRGPSSRRRRRSIGSQCALGRGRRSPEEVDAIVIALVDGVARGCAGAGGRTVVLRLRFDDFTRATRSRTLPRPTAHTGTILAACAGARRRGTAARRGAGPDADRRRRSRTSTTTCPCSSCCRSTTPTWRSTRRSTGCASGSARSRSRAPSCSASRSRRWSIDVEDPCDDGACPACRCASQARPLGPPILRRMLESLAAFVAVSASSSARPARTRRSRSGTRSRADAAAGRDRRRRRARPRALDGRASVGGRRAPRAPPSRVPALKLAGAAYLVYLGGSRSTAASPAAPAARREARAADAAATRLARASSATSAIRRSRSFFASLLPVRPGRPGAFAGFLALGLLFCAMTLAWLSLYAVAVHRLREVLAGGPRRAGPRRARRASSSSARAPRSPRRAVPSPR